MKCSKNLFPDGHPYQHTRDRIDGRPRRRQPGRRPPTGSATNMAPTMPCWCWPATSTPAEARPLVERYFGAIPRGPVNNPGAGRGADARRAQVDGDEGPRRGDQRVALLGGSRPARPPAGRARRRRLGARRPRQLAPRQDAGARREDRGRRPRPGCTRSSASASSTRQATVKPGVDPALVEARLDEMVARISSPRARPRTKSSAPRSAKSAAASAGSSRSAASAARPSRWPRAQTFAGDSDFYKQDARHLRRGDPGRSAARRCASG